MAFTTDQYFPQMEEMNEWVDFDQFLDLPADLDDQSTATTVSPQDLALPFDANDMLSSPFDTMQSSFHMINHDLPQEFMGMDGGYMQESTAPLFDDATLFGYNPYDSSNTFRNLVEVHAAADPRVASIKEKRREASIALHLQRLCEATALDLDMSSDSNTSFSSPNLSDFARGSISPRLSPEKMSISEAPPPGGIQMVLDLNMNAAANVPKKQKPRSQAQRENYIKARKYGACEKHKKQHKRCNCLEKAAARAATGDVPINATLQGRPRQQTMLPVPILPEARYSSSPGHDPSINSPQALPLIKQTIKSAVNTSRKSANRSSGHDPSLGSPTGLPVAVPIHRDIIKTKSQKTAPPGQSSVFSTKDTATGQSHDPCTHTNPRSIRATQKPAGSARLRWRVSMPSPVGIVSSEAINTRPKCLPNCPVTRDVGSPGLDVRQTKSNRPASSPVVSGTAAGNLAFSHASTATQKSGIKSLGKDHKQLPQGLAKQLAVLSGLQLVPSHLSNSPSRRGSPTFSGLELSATRTWSPGPLARSVARNIGVLISSTASAFAAVWQSSLSSSHGSDNVIHKCLSLFGQNLMSAKKSLNWGELEIGYPA